MNPVIRSVLITLLLGVLSAGCTSLKSRYAMDDPVYAEKYADGAEKEEVFKKVKQSLDARHTGGLNGLYLSGGVQSARAAALVAGAEVGMESYLASWASSRIGIAGYIGQDDGYAGLDANLRFQLPTRLAPFAGIGTFHGISKTKVLADFDGLDNDDDGAIDERGEKKTKIDEWISSVYPELGIHWWINGSWRVTTSGKYFVTTEGRSQDDWWIGSQVTVFSR